MHNASSRRCTRQSDLPLFWVLAALVALLLAVDSSSGADENTITPPRTVVRLAVFMADGKRVLVGRDNGAIEVRTVPDGKQVAALQGPVELGDVAVSLDGRSIAASDRGYHSEVHLWDAVTLKPLAPIRLTGKRVFGVVFSPAGDLMAIGACDDKPNADDKTVVIWDTKTRSVRKVLHGDIWGARYLAFSRYGSVLVCAGRDRWVDVWYDPDRYHRSGGRGVQGNSNEVTCVAFLPDPPGAPGLPGGRLFASARGAVVCDWRQLLRQRYSRVPMLQ
jgi:WD40 repeat protein